MNKKIPMNVRSREEIEETLTHIDVMGDKTYAVLKSNATLGQIEIPDWLWTLCGKTIDVADERIRTHKFDYNYFDFPDPKEERTTIHIIYFMEEWLEPIN